MVQRAMADIEQNKGLPNIVLYKNNVDGKGAATVTVMKNYGYF